MNFLTRLATTLAIVSTSALFAYGAPAFAEIVKKDVPYSLAGKHYVGYIAYDNAKMGKLPGVLVAHNWMGITDETKSKVDQLAELGYVAFAVDIYGRDGRPQNTEEAGALASGFKKDRIPLRNRMHQGLKVLREQKNVDAKKLAVIGYCFGGTAAIELARAGADLRATISFHGGLDSPKPKDGARIKGMVLALHGADDKSISSADLTAFEKEMVDNKVDWELVKYGGAVHSFTDKGAGNDNSKGAAYNAKADARSWAAMRQALKEAFQ